MHRIAGVLLSSALIACASAPRSGPETFQAKLDPASEVPAPSIGSAMPSGTASFTNDGSSIVYKVSVSGLSSAPVAAHIHVGAPGAAGPVIVPLVVVAGPGEGTAVGEGSIDAAAIKGKNADGSPMTFGGLLAALRGGSTYVNVHTANNKAGEVRGQIQP